MRNLGFLIILIGALTFGTSCKSQKESVSAQPVPSAQQDQRKGPPAGERGQRGGQNMDERFASMDTNGDGKLAKGEVKGRFAERFDSIDTNKDGFISLEEMKNAPRPQRGQRPQRG